MASGLLLDVAVILAASAVVVFALQRLKQPAILGYLLAGALLGPFGTRLVTDVTRIEQIADVGILILMFAIGLESSLARLAPVRRIAVGGGILQIGFTVIATVLLLRAVGWPSNRAIFLGCIVAMSSTAIVMRTLQERGEQDAPHGQIALGMLVLQDLAIVPMVVILKEVIRPGGEVVTPALAALGKAAAALAAALALAKLVVPFVFDQVAKTRSRELFSIAVLGLALVTGLATEAAGLSVALGAFLAGMALAGTDKDHEARAIVGPFRDAFAGVFFVSVGMLLDGRFLLENPGEVALIVAIVLIGNSVVTFLALVLMRCPVRVAILVAIAISQVGEFGFVIAKMGREAELIAAKTYQLTISASVITMLLTPVMIWVGARIAGRLAASPLFRDASAGPDIPSELGAVLDRHAIVCGYGPMGRAVAKGLSMNDVPFVVLELNSETVRAARAEGIRIFFADAAQPEVLERAGIHKAKAILVTVPDPLGARAIVQLAHQLAPDARIAVRTKFASAATPLIDLGADDVIVEELESGLEMLARTLRVFDVPRAKIASHLDDARSVHRSQARDIKVRKKTLGEITRVLRRVEVEIVEINPGSSLDGSTIGRAAREAGGVTILAVMREQETIPSPGATWQLRALDRMVVFGGGSQVAAIEALAQAVSTEELTPVKPPEPPAR